MSIDTVGNFITIIRNAIMASKPHVVASYSKMNAEIARILQEEGFVSNVEEVTVGEGVASKKLKITLKYVDGESVIHEITRVSKPSRRMYVGVKEIKPVIGGLGIAILSTNRGIMTDKAAKHESNFVGGEILCNVW